MALDKKSLEKERKRLTSIIQQWNESRLDLFAISLPDEKLECHGVMRFYHKDSSNNGKYATKCIRVSSNSSTKDVVEMLSTKFRPDMRMLTKPKYVINEVHVDGEMRQLKDKEKPFLVQLSWVKDDREGRFLLHNLDDKAPVRLMDQFVGPNNEDSSFKLTRNLTKKEKRLKKKQEKEKASKKNSNSTDGGSDARLQEIYTVKHLYSQVPESTFTRTVSNPEAVMKKRREQKLQKRGANILKVYGDRINPEIPYKSLLLLPTDNVTTVTRDALDKYGLGKEQTKDYKLIQVVLPPNSKPEELLNGGWGMETVLVDPKCPLDIEQNWKPHEGTLVFQLRHIAIDSKNSKQSASPPSSNVGATEKTKENSDQRSKNKKKPSSPRLDKTQRTTNTKSTLDSHQNGESSNEEFPKFLEISTSSDQVKEHAISPNVTEIGSDRRKASYGPFIELRRNDIEPSHCVVTNMDGVVTVTPQNRSEVFVDGNRIEETTMLSHGTVVRVGRGKDLVYCEPGGSKISMPQIRKKLQTFAQSRAAMQDRQQRPPNTQHQQRMPVMKQKSSSTLPREMDDQPPGSARGPTSSTSSTQSKQFSIAGFNQSHKSNPAPHQPLKVPILPATIQLRSGAEETFLMEVVSITGMNLHFKLSPAYAVYLSLRDIVDVTPKLSLGPVLVEYLCTTTDLFDQTIQLNSKVATELAFWMANASELLNFVRHDRDVSSSTAEAQDTLAKTVQLAFRHLVQCMQRELFQLMPAFLSQSDDDLPGGNESNARNRPSDQPSMYNILRMLSSAMSLLRRCRVNAALTIQLFSQLFHFVNMWIFNEVVTKPEKGLCCRLWGIKLRARLARVEGWAEKQGLELAADCHLARVTQAMHLLQAPKQSAEDIANISGTCFKLNSLQLRALLSRYIPSERDGETQIPNELIDKVVHVARNTADELTRSDGREVQLEEDPDLQLPFLLPEDGYSCDVVHSVPSGLTEFTRPLVAESVCVYAVNAEASGSWTVHFLGEEPPQEAATTPGPAPPSSNLPPLVLGQPETATVTFDKHGGGLGLSIVAARGPGQTSMGIYIRSVVKGGAGDRDGRLQAGDQLVNIDGHSLVGLSQEKAAEIMTKTGQIVTLTVAKKAALFHGLAPLLEPSPQHERAPVTHRRPGRQQQQQPRPKSDGFALHQQGFHPNDNPPHANQGNQSHPPSSQRPAAHYPNRRKSPINMSTTQLNEERDHRMPVTRSSNQAPRTAMSMGNLQHTENDGSKPRQKTWEAKMAHSTYQRNRAKSSSTATLTSSSSVENQSSKDNQYSRRKQVESLFTGHMSPRQHDHNSPPKSATENLARTRQSAQQQHSIDNPNYEQLPPAPTPPPESPLNSKSSDTQSSKTDSPRDYYAHQPSKNQMKDARFPSPKSSHTMGRPVDTRTVEPSPKASPIPKAEKSKSSTLPRHFKSGSAWDADERQMAIQEQLNALRDEEIDELSARIDTLSTLEKSRLNNLLKEREFQRRVEEESRRTFSDEDNSDEGYEVPDRPDRDRLIQLQDDHAGQVDALRDQEEELRREEERERKRQLERERREEEERERRLRERLDRERFFEEEERLRKEDEMRRFEEEEERRQYEEERSRREQQLRRMEEEKMWREDERMKRGEIEKARREEEKRKLEEEGMRREKEELERQRREWLMEERERREREEKQRAFQREREQREGEAERRQNELQLKERTYREIQRTTEEDEKEEAERELLEKKLSRGKPSNYPKFSRPSAYGSASVYGRHTSTAGSTYQPPTANKPKMRPSVDKAPRPVSDGYFLGKTNHLPDEKDMKTSQNSVSNFNVSTTSPTSPSGNPRSPGSNSASYSTPRVIGSQERYRDPRDKREAAIKRDQSMKRRQQEPSFLTFKDRQRLFSAGQDSPIDKPKASKKLLEIESNLRRSQMS